METLPTKFVSIMAAMICVLPVIGQQQDAAVEVSQTAAQAARAAQRKLKAEQRALDALEGKPLLIYGGFFVDLSRAERKSKFLSLRQPRDARNDYKHVYMDERTERPKGFVLFSLEF